MSLHLRRNYIPNELSTMHIIDSLKWYKIFSNDRFLDEDGKYSPNEKLVPFGLGKRMCPGKTLADTEIFLFLASFIQRFRFSFPRDKELPREIEPEVGFILVCPSYDIIIEERWWY